MDYFSLDTIQYYRECAALAEGEGYWLVDLKIVPQKTQKKVTLVIARKDASGGAIGISDCAKVHRLVEPKLEALLGTGDLYMEVTSPGMERTIRNAAEFALFTGSEVRVWDTAVNDWVSGTIQSSDETSLTLAVEGGSTVYGYDRIAKAKLLGT